MHQEEPKQLTSQIDTLPLIRNLPSIIEAKALCRESIKARPDLQLCPTRRRGPKVNTEIGPCGLDLCARARGDSPALLLLAVAVPELERLAVGEGSVFDVEAFPAERGGV